MEIDKLVEQAQTRAVQPKVMDDKLTFAQEPDVSTLTPDQKEIFDGVMHATEQGGGITLVKGYAGTGKTYLTNTIMEMLLATTNHTVAVTAPTNKAVKVLKRASKFSESMLNLRFSTIHSLLGLREKIDGYGRQRFVKIRNEDVKVGEYSVIIIDEVSMLSDDLYNQLMPYLTMYGITLILIGDPAQIPPVGKENCIPFTEAGVAKWNIGVYQLTNVLRQAKGNPIIALTMKLRNALGRANAIPVARDEYSEVTQDGVYYLGDGPDDMDNFNKLLSTYFTSELFKQDADYVKVIAWTNKTVKAFNRKIRTMIYGSEVKRIEIGEKLIANKPIVDQDTNDIMFSTNDEFEVLSYTVESTQYEGVDLNHYKALVADTDGETKSVNIIHESSASDYKLIIEHLADLAKAHKAGGWEAAAAWKTFFRVQELFGDVSYNYAISAHKSQGSTYENVFVVQPDIDKNFKIKERNRIKYTAMTRPSAKLFIIK